MNQTHTLTAQLVTDVRSLSEMQSLLQESKLPYQDVRVEGNIMVAYHDKNQLVACGGLEIYGIYALLRSVAVAESHRGQTLGQQVVDDLLSRARTKGLKAIYLLTETAHDFFLKKGFTDIDRSQVPTEVKSSSEFTSVCPLSAACMVQAL